MPGIASNRVAPPLYQRQPKVRPRSEAKRARIEVGRFAVEIEDSRPIGSFRAVRYHQQSGDWVKFGEVTAPANHGSTDTTPGAAWASGRSVLPSHIATTFSKITQSTAGRMSTFRENFIYTSEGPISGSTRLFPPPGKSPENSKSPR